MITAFVDMLGLIIVYPLLPFYAQHLGANAAMVGALVASFSVAQLLAAPVGGWLSDRYGRRPAILVGLLLSAVAYLIFAFADSLWLLFLSRLVQGLGGGTIGVVQAYVSDVSAPVQLHHGTADADVPLVFSQTLLQELMAAGKAAELFTYAGDNHNISNNFSIAMSRSIAFFDRALKG